MSFNIRYGSAKDGKNAWDCRKELLVSLLNNSCPDIVCLQESLPFQTSYILLNTNVKYSAFGSGREADLGGESTCILVSPCFEVLLSDTFWFSDTPTSPGSKSFGNFLPRICTLVKLKDSNHVEFWVFNLHLDHESEASRILSVKQLSNYLPKNHAFPVIIAGDFNNLQISSPEILHLKNTGFSDSHFELFGNYPGTFHDFTGKPSSPKIDFIWKRGNLKTLESVVMTDSDHGLYPSDHFPVFCKLMFE